MGHSPVPALYKKIQAPPGTSRSRIMFAQNLRAGTVQERLRQRVQWGWGRRGESRWGPERPLADAKGNNPTLHSHGLQARGTQPYLGCFRQGNSLQGPWVQGTHSARSQKGLCGCARGGGGRSGSQCV